MSSWDNANHGKAARVDLKGGGGGLNDPGKQNDNLFYSFFYSQSLLM